MRYGTYLAEMVFAVDLFAVVGWFVCAFLDPAWFTLPARAQPEQAGGAAVFMLLVFAFNAAALAALLTRDNRS